MQWGSILTLYNALPPDPEIVGERWRDMWRQRSTRSAVSGGHGCGTNGATNTGNHGSVCEDYDAIECPVYAIGGWTDGYTNAVPRLMANL